MAKISKYHYFLYENPTEIVNLNQGDFELPGKVLITHNNKIPNLEDFIKTKNFKHYDIFTSNNEIYSTIHTHSDREIRLILEGTGTFYVFDGNIRVWQVECFSGTSIFLEPNVVHWFKKGDGYLEALRMFEKNEQHVVEDVTIPQLEKIYNHFK
jgi:cupin superfamily acireductone dioxygenase involved in methionine salvage